MEKLIKEFVFEKNPCPMWIYDLETFRFLNVNQSACEKYGYTKAEMLALTVLDIRPDDDRNEFVSKTTDDLRPTFSSEVYADHINKSGHQFRVKIISYFFTYQGRPSRFVQASDMEDYYSALQDNLKLVEELKQKVSLLKTIAWTQSHELRAKISNVIAMMGLYAQGGFDPCDCSNITKKAGDELKLADKVLIQLVRSIRLEDACSY